MGRQILDTGDTGLANLSRRISRLFPVGGLISTPTPPHPVPFQATAAAAAHSLVMPGTRQQHQHAPLAQDEQQEVQLNNAAASAAAVTPPLRFRLPIAPRTRPTATVSTATALQAALEGRPLTHGTAFHDPHALDYYELGHKGYSYNLWLFRPSPSPTVAGTVKHTDANPTAGSASETSREPGLLNKTSSSESSSLLKQRLQDATTIHAETWIDLSNLTANQSLAVFSRRTMSWDGRVHPGAIGSIVDDCFGLLCFYNDCGGATLNLTLEHLVPVPCDAVMRIRPRLAKREGRKVFIEADVTDETTGLLHSRAKALFYSMFSRDPTQIRNEPASSQPLSTEVDGASDSAGELVPAEGRLPFPGLTEVVAFDAPRPAWVETLQNSLREQHLVDVTDFLYLLVAKMGISHNVLSSPKIRSRYYLDCSPSSTNPASAIQSLVAVFEYTSMAEGPAMAVHGGATHTTCAEIAEVLGLFSSMSVSEAQLWMASPATVDALVAKYLAARPKVRVTAVSTNYKVFMPLLNFFRWSAKVTSRPAPSQLELELQCVNPETDVLHATATCTVVSEGASPVLSRL
ncbi:hypothetical protein CAOG_08268 [Capsaspora owczarzaki ATCC 30864]|uniref:Acyl-coenzyme A thioesterase THEM4 n=1 Tax=Capsaspora owczarzaki (strain ATCC 30864) TaxID=595528 RepID=A0A0D2WY32_CAPO3|nr:hypothetical protein CAOG_08268 [Capsaspora owczarzaki ATCC 30864]KJE98280.1 hypothetical protein CAOG_008268 [Capsaspora owczarzaki ATCC 30864]|eukprot:XP_004342437.1 hypothetical protein CAOG_08268 [Capsaspora owczarzaki ATCC 30864]